jgi:hypothetical protein
MGCGCKNKQDSPVTAAEASKIQQQTIQTKQQQTESVKSAIKKTVEKYYTSSKTTQG